MLDVSWVYMYPYSVFKTLTIVGHCQGFRFCNVIELSVLLVLYEFLE